MAGMGDSSEPLSPSGSITDSLVIDPTRIVCGNTKTYLILVFIALSSNEDSDEPAQMRSLAIAFTARIHTICM